MGNRWSGWFGTSATPVDPQRRSPYPKVRYEVVLPSGGRAWERLYNGDIDTWDAVAARYGMDLFAYDCGMFNCDREAVCLRYFSASLQPNKQAITIERYKRSTLQVPIGSSPGLRALLSEGFQLNQVIAAQRGQLVLLVVRKSIDYMSQVAFPLIHLGDKNNKGDTNVDGDKKKGDKKKKAEKGKLLQRRSSKQQQDGESGNEGETRPSSYSMGGEGEDRPLDQNDGSPDTAKVQVRGRCLGVLHAPHKDMTIISCQLSPDLMQTAVLFYSLSPATGTFCYTLHFYSNPSLQEETSADAKTRAMSSAAALNRSVPATSSAEQQLTTPHLLRTVKLSREVQPYFVFDPRFRSSRIAVANYECRETGINHELVLLNLDGKGGDSSRDAEVVRRGKLSLPSLFGNSRFNLLYSKDGELIILQKLTDDRFGVTSFCDIYIFSADHLNLIKYLTASLPGLFHICKVCYEPVFSRCGNYMRILHFFMPSSHPSHAANNGDNAEEEMEEEECTLVHIYQLPRTLSMMSQCRRVILQQVLSERCIDVLPVPHTLHDYLKFRPIY